MQSLGNAISDPHERVREQALQTVGEVGASEFRVPLLTAVGLDDSIASIWAAWSAVLLGDRRVALEYLAEHGLRTRHRAFVELATLASSPDMNRTNLKRIAANVGDSRLLLLAIGASGDPYYVPWLIERMKNLETAKMAGQAFATITGVDLQMERLDVVPESASTDEPSEVNSFNHEEPLPLPDVDKIGNGGQQTAVGSNRARDTSWVGRSHATAASRF